MVTWDVVETMPKETSKTFKMWHTNQRSGFCCVGSRNVFEDAGYIKEERSKQREQAKEEAVAKQESSKLADKQKAKSKREHKCRRKLVKSSRGDTPIAHRSLLSMQPLVTAMRHNTFNTLGQNYNTQSQP